MEILILNNDYIIVYTGLACAYDNILIFMSYIYNDNMFFNNNYVDELFINKQDKDFGKLLFNFRRISFIEYEPLNWSYKPNILMFKNQFINWGAFGRFLFFFDFDLLNYFSYLYDNNISSIYFNNMAEIDLKSNYLNLPYFFENRYNHRITSFDFYHLFQSTHRSFNVEWVTLIKSYQIYLNKFYLLPNRFFNKLGSFIYSFFTIFHYLFFSCIAQGLEYVVLSFWLLLQKCIPWFFLDGDIVFFFTTLGWYIKYIFFVRPNDLFISFFVSILNISKFFYFSFFIISNKIDDIIFFFLYIFNYSYIFGQIQIYKFYLSVDKLLSLIFSEFKLRLVYYFFLKIFFIFYFINEKNVDILLKNNEIIYFFYIYYLPDFLKINNYVALNPLFTNDLINTIFIKIIRNELNPDFLKTVKIDNSDLIEDIVNNEKLIYYLNNKSNDNKLAAIIFNNYDNQKNFDFNFKILKKKITYISYIKDFFMFDQIAQVRSNIAVFMDETRNFLTQPRQLIFIINQLISMSKMLPAYVALPLHISVDVFLSQYYGLTKTVMLNYAFDTSSYLLNLYILNFKRFFSFFFNTSHLISYDIYNMCKRVFYIVSDLDELVFYKDFYIEHLIDSLTLIYSYITIEEESLFDIKKFNKKLESASIIIDCIYYYKYEDLMQQNVFWNNIYVYLNMVDIEIVDVSTQDLKVKFKNSSFYYDDEFLEQLRNNKIDDYFFINDLFFIFRRLKNYNQYINYDAFISYPPFNDRLKNELFMLHINENLFNFLETVCHPLFSSFLLFKAFMFSEGSYFSTINYWYNCYRLVFYILKFCFIVYSHMFTFIFSNFLLIIQEISIDDLFDSFLIKGIRKFIYWNLFFYIDVLHYKLYIIYNNYLSNFFPFNFIKWNKFTDWEYGHDFYIYFYRSLSKMTYNIYNFITNKEYINLYMDFLKQNNDIKKNAFIPALKNLWIKLDIYPQVFLTKFNYLVYTNNLNIQFDDNLNFFIYEKNIDVFWNKLEPIYNRSNFDNLNELYKRKMPVTNDLYLHLNIKKSFFSKLRTNGFDKNVYIFFLENYSIKKNFIFNNNRNNKFILYFIVIFFYFLFFFKITKKFIIFNLILLYKLLIYIIKLINLYYNKDYFFIKNKIINKGVFYYKPLFISFNLYSYMLEWSLIYRNNINLKFDYYFDNSTIYKSIESETSIFYWLKNIKIIFSFICDLLRFFCFFYIKNIYNFFLHNIKYFFIYLYWNNSILVNHTTIGRMFIDFFLIIDQFFFFIKTRLLLLKIYKYLRTHYRTKKYYNFLKGRLLKNKVFTDISGLTDFIQPEVLTKFVEFTKFVQRLDIIIFNLRELTNVISKKEEIEFWSFIGIYNDLFVTKSEYYHIFRYTLDQTYIKRPDKFLYFFFRFNLFFYSKNKPLTIQKPIIIFDESLLDFLLFTHRNNQFKDFINLGFNLDYYLNFLKNLNKIIILFFSNNVIIYLITLNYFTRYLKLEIYLKFFSFYFLRLVLIIFYIFFNKNALSIIFNFLQKYFNFLLFIFLKIKYSFFLIIEFINYYIFFNILVLLKYISFILIVFIVFVFIFNLDIINLLLQSLLLFLNYFYIDLFNIDFYFYYLIFFFELIFYIIEEYFFIKILNIFIYFFFYLQMYVNWDSIDYIRYLSFWNLILNNSKLSIELFPQKVFNLKKLYKIIPSDYVYGFFLLIFKYIYFFFQPYWFFFLKNWPFFTENFYWSDYLVKGYVNIRIYYQYRALYDILYLNLFFFIFKIYYILKYIFWILFDWFYNYVIIYKRVYINAYLFPYYTLLFYFLLDQLEDLFFYIVMLVFLLKYIYYSFFLWIIDYIYIICYNFFIIQSFLNFFLFLFNFFLFYSDKLFFYFNLDIIKDTIFNPKYTSTSLYSFPYTKAFEEFGGYFNIDITLWTKSYLDREFIWYSFLNELKHLFFFQTFYNFYNKINVTYLLFLFIYYFLFYKLIILIFSFINSWFFITFFNNDMSLFFSHYLNWKNYNYWKKERYYYFKKNNNIIFNDLPVLYFFGSYNTLDKFLYSKCANFLFENKKYDLFRGRTQYMENKYILRQCDKDYIKTKDILLNKEDYPIMNYELLINNILNNQKKEHYDFFLESIYFFKNYQIFWYGFFDKIFLYNNIDKMGKHYYYEFRRLYDWPLPLDYDEFNMITVPLKVQDSFFFESGVTNKNTYSLLLNSYWKYDINFELNEKKNNLNSNLNYKLKNMLKNTSNIIIKDIRTRFFFRDLNINRYFLNYLNYPLLFLTFDSKFLDKNLFNDFKYLFPGLLPKNINIYNKYFLIEKWFLEQYNILPLSPSFLTVLNDNLLFRSLFDSYLILSNPSFDEYDLKRNWNSNLIPESNYAIIQHIVDNDNFLDDSESFNLNTNDYFLYELNNDFELLNEFDYKFFNWIFFVDNFFFKNRINPYKMDNLNQYKFSVFQIDISTDLVEKHEYYLKNINNQLIFNLFDFNKNIYNKKNWNYLMNKLNKSNNLQLNLNFDTIALKDEGNFSNIKLLYVLNTNPIQFAMLFILVYVPITFLFLNADSTWLEREHNYLLIGLVDLKNLQAPICDYSLSKRYEERDYEDITGIFDIFLKLPIFINRFFLSNFFLDYSLPWSNYNTLFTNNEVFEDWADDDDEFYYGPELDDWHWYRSVLHNCIEFTTEAWALDVSDIAWHYTFLNLLGNKPFFFNKMSKFFFFDYNYNYFFFNNYYLVHNWLCQNNINDFYYANLLNNNLNGSVFLNSLIFNKKWLVNYLLYSFDFLENNNSFFFFNEKVNNNFFYYYLNKKAEFFLYYDNYFLLKEHVIKFTTKAEKNYFGDFNKNINIYYKNSQYFYNISTVNLKVPIFEDYYFFNFLNLYNKSPESIYPLNSILKSDTDLIYKDNDYLNSLFKKSKITNTIEYVSFQKKLEYIQIHSEDLYNMYMRMYYEFNPGDELLKELVIGPDQETPISRLKTKEFLKQIGKKKQVIYNKKLVENLSQFIKTGYRGLLTFKLNSFDTFYPIFLKKDYYLNNHILDLYYWNNTNIISSTYLDFFQKKWIDYNKYSILNYNLINEKDILNNFIYKNNSFFLKNDNNIFWLFDRWLSIKELFGFFWFDDNNFNFFYGFYNFFSYFLFYFFFFRFLFLFFFFNNKYKFYVLFNKRLFKKQVILKKKNKNKKKKQIKENLFNNLIIYDKLKYKTILKNILNIKNYKKF